MTEDRKKQAKVNVLEMLISWRKGNKKKLYKLTLLSWRKNSKYSLKKKHSKEQLGLCLNEILAYDILEIKLIAPVMADAIVNIIFANSKLSGVYRIRFISESEPYITSASVPFRFNPNSIRQIDL